jgi:hypothetical protein
MGVMCHSYKFKDDNPRVEIYPDLLDGRVVFRVEHSEGHSRLDIPAEQAVRMGEALIRAAEILEGAKVTNEGGA